VQALNDLEEKEEEVVCDALVACAGTRPDPTLLAELHVHLCYATEGPMKLAAALMAAGGGGGDCLAQVLSRPRENRATLAAWLRVSLLELPAHGTRAYGNPTECLMLC